ncbi:MAG: hypothetical protein A3G23_01325 [Bacteroidetes bacterium RIFCSPLOWO2_12_FULL_37_12]|nr:MAG: hypothetical protein A3G23_01325 [Bacteroidetes bacterium RIFCSPLOWO2_12_FULL_37_12]
MTCSTNFLRIILPIALFLNGCTPVIFSPVDSDLQRAKKYWNDITLEHLKSGYKLYVSKCGGCHTLYPPQQFPKEKWIKLMPDMAKEAKLDSVRIGLIARYILTMQTVNPKER